jgi:hypothetical protein
MFECGKRYKNEPFAALLNTTMVFSASSKNPEEATMRGIYPVNGCWLVDVNFTLWIHTRYGRKRLNTIELEKSQQLVLL